MEVVKGQVKVLANTHTGRETYVDLNDVVLYPGTEKEIKLGDFLQKQDKRIEKVENAVKELKTIAKTTAGIISKINLK